MRGSSAFQDFMLTMIVLCLCVIGVSLQEIRNAVGLNQPVGVAPVSTQSP